jgi:hypothetical protein
MRGKYKSFVFGETLQLMLEPLSPAKQAKFYKYIVNYGLYGKEPDLVKMERALWVGMKALIDNLKKEPDNEVENPPKSAKDYSKKIEKKADFNEKKEILEESDEKKEILKNFNEKTEKNSVFLNPNKNKNKNINKNTNININTLENDERFNNSRMCVEVFEKHEKPEQELKKSPDSECIPADFDKYAALHPAFSPPNEDFYEKIRAAWNEYPVLPQCRDILINLNAEKSSILSKAIKTYEVSEIINAIENYCWMVKNPQKVKQVLRYSNMFSFLEKALPVFSVDRVFGSQYVKEEYVKKEEA